MRESKVSKMKKTAEILRDTPKTQKIVVRENGEENASVFPYYILFFFWRDTQGSPPPLLPSPQSKKV